jgi:hypothetical protein
MAKAKTAKTEAPKPEKVPKTAETKTWIGESYNPGDWRDAASTFAPDDESLDAQMWRMARQQKDPLGE